jgi:succinate-semialdehyde dehydrogenase/glutarate-semialdehyde dehydrogenase
VVEIPAKVASLAGVRHSWIGNRETEGLAGRREVRSPWNGRPLAEVSLLAEDQARGAIAAAESAAPAWRRRSFADRRRLLMRARGLLAERAGEVARLIEAEQGKPAAEAHAVEVFPALESLKHTARHAEEALREEEVESSVFLFAAKQGRLLYVPYGVVLVVTPWNYPFFLALSAVATALAAGNTVVLKPAPATTSSGLEIGRLFRDAGFPDGALSVVAVDDSAAPALVEDPRIGKIVFIGSVETGRKVMAGAAKNLTPVLLELGGKDATIVCRDADLERAAKGVVWGAFVNAGQTCVAVERVYVEEPVAEAFVARVVEETRALRTGGTPADTDVGPMTLERQRRVVEEHLADAVARGARVLTGGARPPGAGCFFPPTVLIGVDHSMRIMREETFGPLLPIMTVSSMEDAIRLANDSDYGLTASAWTRDPGKARRLQEELSAGVVTINDCVSSLGEPGAPYGGMRRSGIGRAHGTAGIREMCQLKYASRDVSGGPALWWYPYDADFGRVLGAAAAALHAPSLLARLRGLFRIVRSPRFWRRVPLRTLVRGLDRIF